MRIIIKGSVEEGRNVHASAFTPAAAAAKNRCLARDDRQREPELFREHKYSNRPGKMCCGRFVKQTYNFEGPIRSLMSCPSTLQPSSSSSS